MILICSTCFALWNKKKEKSDFKITFLLPLRDLSLRGIFFLFAILLFKLPWQTYGKYRNGEALSAPQLLKSTILGHFSTSHPSNKKSMAKLLLAQNSGIEHLEAQNRIDEEAENQALAELSLEQCQAETFSKEELEKNKQKAPGGALLEDFGRYVGFGGRPFKKTGVAGLFFNAIFPKDNTCYGFNTDAVLLCKNIDVIINRDLATLEKLVPQLSNKEGKVAKLIQDALSVSDDIVKFQDAFKGLLTYVQEHSIATTKHVVMIPYRYIVPFNAIFNRSLQNHSSYYTDIGLIWIFVLILLI